MKIWNSYWIVFILKNKLWSFILISEYIYIYGTIFLFLALNGLVHPFFFFLILSIYIYIYRKLRRYVPVCVYVGLYICVYVYMYIYKYIYIYICGDVRVYGIYIQLILYWLSNLFFFWWYMNIYIYIYIWHYFLIL